MLILTGWPQLASEQGHASTVHVLASHGAAINHTDVDGNTALHGASQEGHHAAVEALLSHAAFPNHLNSSGFSALHFAVASGHLGTTRALASRQHEFGCLDTMTPDNLTPLQLCRYRTLSSHLCACNKTCMLATTLFSLSVVSHSYTFDAGSITHRIIW